MSQRWGRKKKKVLYSELLIYFRYIFAHLHMFQKNLGRFPETPVDSSQNWTHPPLPTTLSFESGQGRPRSRHLMNPSYWPWVGFRFEGLNLPSVIHELADVFLICFFWKNIWYAMLLIYFKYSWLVWPTSLHICTYIMNISCKDMFQCIWCHHWVNVEVAMQSIGLLWHMLTALVIRISRISETDALEYTTQIQFIYLRSQNLDIFSALHHHSHRSMLPVEPLSVHHLVTWWQNHNWVDSNDLHPTSKRGYPNLHHECSSFDPPNLDTKVVHTASCQKLQPMS